MTTCLELVRQINHALRTGDYTAVDRLRIELRERDANPAAPRRTPPKPRAKYRFLTETRCARCNAATFAPGLTCPMCRLVRLQGTKQGGV